VALGGRVDRALDHRADLGLRLGPPRRRPQREADHLRTIHASDDQRGGIDVQDAALTVEQRDEARRLGVGDLRHELVRDRVVLRPVDLLHALPEGFDDVERGTPVIESFR
jgi:hypothetical protein